MFTFLYSVYTQPNEARRGKQHSKVIKSCLLCPKKCNQRWRLSQTYPRGIIMVDNLWWCPLFWMIGWVVFFSLIWYRRPRWDLLCLMVKYFSGVMNYLLFVDRTLMLMDCLWCFKERLRFLSASKMSSLYQ